MLEDGIKFKEYNFVHYFTISYTLYIFGVYLFNDIYDELLNLLVYEVSIRAENYIVPHAVFFKYLNN